MTELLLLDVLRNTAELHTNLEIMKMLMVSSSVVKMAEGQARVPINLTASARPLKLKSHLLAVQVCRKETGSYAVSSSPLRCNITSKEKQYEP